MARLRKGEIMTDLVNKKEKKAGALTANMWIYALGLMGINLGIGLINSYQAEFFNKILQADLMAVAGIILAAKFISIVADFVIGNLIDRANFKAGKMRPWILFSAFPLAVLTMIFVCVYSVFFKRRQIYLHHLRRCALEYIHDDGGHPLARHAFAHFEEQ